jgi:hypothetical protein
MDNLDTLIMGEVLSMKDVTSITIELETYMRADVGDQGKSQVQLLADWLNGGETELDDLIDASPQ